MRDPRAHSGCRGFTLIETIAVIVVLAVVGTLVSYIMMASVQTAYDVSAQNQLHAEATVALDRIVRELRGIDSVEQQSREVPDIDRATATMIEWGSDSLLEWSGDRLLLKTDGSHSDILATDVGEFRLAYFDANNESLPPAPQVPPGRLRDVQRIAVHIMLRRGPHEHALHTKVFLRCGRKAES